MKFIDLQTQYQQNKEAIDRRIQAVLEHGQYIMGPEVLELEKALADFVGAKHCVSTSSGTDALIMALMALDIQPGDEVITSPFSFFASAEIIVLMGAIPVFVDINLDTYNIDSSKIIEAITPKTKAIMPVCLYGQCAEMDSINEIAEKHGLPVVEDAAQSFGATYKGRKSCNLSTIGCTSFFPSKPLGGYGDAGACFINDDHLAEQMKQIRAHGQDGRYNHVRLGFTGRLDTLQAAVLLEKLKIFDDEIKKRQQVAEFYKEHLPAHISPPNISPDCLSVFAQYTIRVDDRDAFQKKLQEAGIPTAVHYPKPLYEQPSIKDKVKLVGDLSKVEQAAREVISLPMHPYLTREQVQEICKYI